MRHTLKLLTAFTMFTTISALTLAQQPAPASVESISPEGTEVFRISTQLVMVDVTVQDKNGHPVHGLKRDDFILMENKRPQAIHDFDEHANTDKLQPGPELPPLPPGTFTDYTSTPPSGALNILLLDSLNTPMKDQSYVRYELQQYVKKAQPGTRVAIFGLAQHLFLLQGFSSDPAILKDAVEHKLIPRASNLLNDPSGGGQAATELSDLPQGMDQMMAQTAGNLQQFDAETQAYQTQLRIQYTLDALNTLAHYLAVFPGHKNLIWFSGSFPISILPDPGIENSFSAMEDNDPKFRETTNLLARAQVAVYPIDARGLMSTPAFDSANPGRAYSSNPSKFGKDITDFDQSQAEEHLTMEQLAQDTGGRVSYNTNDLASAVKSAIDSGSNYYTLAYSPEDKKRNGEYRNIRVQLAPNLVAANYNLSYRHGYYADAPYQPSKGHAIVTTTTEAPQPASSGVTYAQEAMSRGAPAPEEILFKVRVLPASAGTEDSLAPANNTDPVHPLKPPYRRYVIDFAAVANDFKLTTQPDGRRTGTIEFSAYLFDSAGHLLNATGQTIALNFTPDMYKRFQNGVDDHLEISAPAKGETYLRLGVHDVDANRLGVVEIPITSVAHLPPLQTATAPSRGPIPSVTK